MKLQIALTPSLLLENAALAVYVRKSSDVYMCTYVYYTSTLNLHSYHSVSRRYMRMVQTAPPTRYTFKAKVLRLSILHTPAHTHMHDFWCTLALQFRNLSFINNLHLPEAGVCGVLKGNYSTSLRCPIMLMLYIYVHM